MNTFECRQCPASISLTKSNKITLNQSSLGNKLSWSALHISHNALPNEDIITFQFTSERTCNNYDVFFFQTLNLNYNKTKTPQNASDMRYRGIRFVGSNIDNTDTLGKAVCRSDV